MTVSERHGARWSDSEYSQLRRLVRKGKTLEQIAQRHRRSETAIEYAMTRLGLTNPSDIVINSHNYSELLRKARGLIHLKIELLAR